MRGNEEKAKEHEKAAREALSVSVFKLKFSPDYFQAATHLTEAAQCYAAARMDTEAKATYAKAAELRLKDNDHASAARCYELGALFDKASECYMLCGSLDQAVRCVMKKAALPGLEPAAQIECYEKAIDIYSKDDGKDVMASDIFKQYIPKLLVGGQTVKYFEVSKQYMELLCRLEQWPFAHKEILSQVIVNLSKDELVGAERVLSGPNLNVIGFAQSQEFAVADELISAIKDNDAEALKKIVSKPTVTYLNSEIVKLAKSIKTMTVTAVPTPGQTQAEQNIDHLLL